MPDAISTRRAATLLGTTPPTVRSLIARGSLRATRRPRQSRFSWEIEPASVDAYLKEHGRRDGRKRHAPSRLTVLEREVAEIRSALTADGRPRGDPDSDAARERDRLRVELGQAREILARMGMAAELQQKAADERSVMTQALLSAIAAGERADRLGREAAVQLGEAVSDVARPGNLDGIL